MVVSAVFACSGTRSLDPTGFDRSCAVDTDCIVVEPVNDCSSCCTSAVAVRNTPEVREAVADVADSCSSKRSCMADCGEPAAVCVSGRCEKATPWNTNGPGGQLSNGKSP